MKNINLLIDFDSTFIQVETIEILADIALSRSANKLNILNQIKDLTHLAMNGEISFQNALKKRIQLINANSNHINKTIELIRGKITPSIENNREFFIKNSSNCYIVSGGFNEIISPLVKPYGFKVKNIFANSFILNSDGEIISIDDNNPLSQDKGKAKIAQNIKGTNIVIGDGYTDYEVKKLNHAKLFIQFIENINRKGLNNKADKIVNNFGQIINYLETTNEI